MTQHPVTNSSRKTGVYFLDLSALDELLRARGLTRTELKQRGVIDAKTFDKIYAGRGIQAGSVSKLLKHLGITNRTGLVFAEGEDKESHFSRSLRQSGVQEWNVETPLTPVITTSKWTSIPRLSSVASPPN